MIKFKNTFVFLLLICLIISSGLTACATNTALAETENNTEAGQNNAADVLVLNYSGQDINVPVEEIMQLKAVIRDVTALPKDDEEKEARNVKGVLLDDVLQKYLQIAQKDAASLRLIAGDGYAIEVAPDIIKSRQIILAYEIDGEPLEDWEKPLRSVIPEVFAMYWVKNLVKIEIIMSMQQAEVKRIIILEARISEIETVDYQYYDEKARAAYIEGLLYEFSENPANDTVVVKSSDGLEKNEKTEIFKKGFIKYTGENSPMFLSDDLPKGMWIKNILYFIYGGSAYFSAQSGFSSMTVSEADGNDAIKLSDVFSACGIIQSDKYLFKAIDGYTVELDSASVDKGYIYIQENGLPALYFEGLEKNTKVKDLIYMGISE
ncbi:MAG: molybdopterin-dependent oxidoreductase [Actinobacteria bacterium]|nr:molybdopterin-dependent oxidoreductase [Actinomycetota bacterium]